MSISSPSPSRPMSSFSEMQNATSSNNNNNNNNTKRLRKSIRINDNMGVGLAGNSGGGNIIMVSSPLLGMFSAEGEAPSLRSRNGISSNNNNTIASEERKNSNYGTNKISSEALFQYYAIKGNFEIMHADEFSDGVIHSCLASTTPSLPPVTTTTATVTATTKLQESTQGVEEGSNITNKNKSDEPISSTSALAEMEKTNQANANNINVVINNDWNNLDSEYCSMYNYLRPPQANDVIVKVTTRKQIEEQQKNASAQLRLSMMALPPLCSYYYNLYKGDATTAPLVNEIQVGLVHEAQRVEKKVIEHKREVASRSSYTSTSRSKEINKTRLTNTITQNNTNQLPNWNQSPKTMSLTSALNYTESNNNINNNNNNNNNNTFNNSASSSSMMLMGATTNVNNNNIPAPPPLLASASSARSISAQGNHHLPSQTHPRNGSIIEVNAENVSLLANTENIITSNHAEKEFNQLLELHAKRMQLLGKLESAFAKFKAEVSINNTINAEFNKTNTFTRLSMTATGTTSITTHETNKKDAKKKKNSKKRKAGEHEEEKPSNIPVNLTYFINALLPFVDRAGRVSLRVVECAFHSAPFEVATNAQNEAVRTLFYWINNHSQAMHDNSATGYDASKGVGEEDTDSSPFASGANINVRNSINVRTNTLMTTTNTTNSSNSNEEKNKSMSRINKPNSHISSPSDSISINRPSGMSRDISRAMTGSMENKNMMVSGANANAGVITYNSMSGTLRQQSNYGFSKSVKQRALEQYIYLHELIAALDGLINSKETGKIARFQCFQALVLSSNGNNYIHRAWLDKIRNEQKQVSQTKMNPSISNKPKNKADYMESTLSQTMKMKTADGCNNNNNNKNAWTPSLVAALNCAFDAIAQNEEAEYVKLMSKRSKRRSKGKDSSNAKGSAATQRNSANAKSASSSSLSSSATPSTGTASNSVIPLNVMRRCHFNFDEFDKWFDIIPMLAASLLPIWLPLLIGTLNLNNVMNSDGERGSHSQSNLDIDNDNDNENVVNADDSKDVSVMESSSARLHRSKTGAESSFSLSLSRKNDVSSAAVTASAADINNAENSFAHSQGDDMGKSNVDNSNNNNNTKTKNTIAPSSDQIRTMQSAQEKKSNTLRVTVESEIDTYPLTLLGDDEMARHAFLQELIKEHITHMNDYVV